MSMEINLLPEEFKPKPLIKPQTLAVVIMVLILGFGCFHFYTTKADNKAQAAEVGDQIDDIQNQIRDYENNSEAVGLKSKIAEKSQEKNKLEGMNNDYITFTNSRIEWGYVINSLREKVPWGVTITAISQGGGGNEVTVQGIANNYDREAAYVTSLEADSLFSDVTTLSWQSSTGQFSLSFTVDAGGDQ